ncbi:hypothetical protein ACFRSX_35740 [Streptomyces goshikiensis]|uniref:hypothetical protein n=1 Tax=Streptomyces TaxID=1883 RepID=UPI001F35C8CF|nr:hypothetical protein [Streptomyces sp. CB02120-2]
MYSYVEHAVVDVGGQTFTKWSPSYVYDQVSAGAAGPTASVDTDATCAPDHVKVSARFDSASVAFVSFPAVYVSSYSRP